MAGKKRQGKKNAGAGNPAKSAPRGRSVHRLQAGIALDALRDDYALWVREQAPGFDKSQAQQVAEMQLDVVKSVGGEYAQAAGNAHLRAIDPELFGEVFAEFLVSLPEGVEVEPIFGAWIDYLQYLAARGLWEGPQEELEALQEILESALTGFAEDDAELVQLLRGTDLYTKVKDLALALGEGVHLDEFTRDDSPARERIMRSVGVDPATTSGDAPAPEVFAHVWNAAVMSVVEPGEELVVRDEAAFASLTEGEAGDSAQVLFEMAVGCVQSHLLPHQDPSERDEAHYLILRNLLVTAVTGKDAEFEPLRRSVGPKLFDVVLPEAQAALASLAGFGLLSAAGDSYEVDERLLPVISAGVSEAESLIEAAE
ncbi:hypothetical protein [Glutamicibacter sp. X7]